MERHSPAMAPLANPPALSPALPDVKTLTGFAVLLVPTVKPYQVEMLKCTFCEDAEEGVTI